MRARRFRQMIVPLKPRQACILSLLVQQVKKPRFVGRKPNLSASSTQQHARNNSDAARPSDHSITRSTVHPILLSSFLRFQLAQNAVDLVFLLQARQAFLKIVLFGNEFSLGLADSLA